jgi:hypothetical protein
LHDSRCAQRKAHATIHYEMQRGTSGPGSLAEGHLAKSFLMPVSRKKVIVRKLSRDWLSGYLPPSAFVVQEQAEMLDLTGKLVSVPMAEVKWICFVRDFQSGDANQPERLLRKTFVTRPRSQGLWVRIRLKDNDLIEGLAPNDLTLLDGEGIFLVPPDTRSNTQRIFLPRQAVAELDILAVIKTGARRGPAEAVQEDLFKGQNSAS